MNIFLFGATGRTGQQIFLQALAAGHDVTALVRRPERFKIHLDRLRVVGGDALDAAAVENVMHGHDIVISALGIAGIANSLRPMTFHVDTARTIIGAMDRAGVRRLIAITSVGVHHDPTSPLWYRGILQPLLRHKYGDMARMEDLVRASSLDWAIVRPVRLTNEALTQDYRIGRDGTISDAGAISRADVADFIIRRLATGEIADRVVALSY